MSQLFVDFAWSNLALNRVLVPVLTKRTGQSYIRTAADKLVFLTILVLSFSFPITNP